MSSLPSGSKWSQLTGNKCFRLTAALCIGAALGAIVSLTVNCTLVEISLNPFFSVVRFFSPFAPSQYHPEFGYVVIFCYFRVQ
jgi:hypothetical protein